MTEKPELCFKLWIKRIICGTQLLILYLITKNEGDKSKKEFFKVSLEEIASVIRANHDKSIEFKMVADADQYREGLKMKS